MPLESKYKLSLAIIGCECVGLASIPFTLTAVASWYPTLIKPTFSPPNWVFGPVWTILYGLMGISWYLIWKQKRSTHRATFLFMAQLGFNFSWSVLFFGLHAPLLGLVNICALLVLIGSTMRQFFSLSRMAFWLLIPYFAWVSFATLLNFAIVILNLKALH